jgi:exosome complex component RRP46
MHNIEHAPHAAVAPTMSATDVRADGRRATMMRSLKTERSLLSRADGSARWEQDGSVVLAAVYGPRGIQARKENTEAMLIEVVYRPASGMQTSADKESEMVIRRTLEQVVLTGMHPRLGIQVVIQVVSGDGAMESCALNAACAALIDAAVHMRGVLCATTCAILPGIGAVADPTEDEERDATAMASLAYCFRGGNAGGAVKGTPPPMALPEAEVEVLQTTSRGAMTEEEFLGLTVLGRDAAFSVFEFFRESVARFHASQAEEIQAGGY